MSNADSLYKAHSNNSFDSESQYTGRYLKLFQQQTKNSKIGTSIFSYQQKKQQPIKHPPPAPQILPNPNPYSPSLSPSNQPHNYYSYATKEEKENEIFGDLERMRNEHLKIMGLMEERETESSRKMEEIEREITRRRSGQGQMQGQGYLPEYNPPTFNNLNGQEERRRDSVENYVTHRMEGVRGSSEDEYQMGAKRQVLNKQQQLQIKTNTNNNSNQQRFTFAPSPNHFIPNLPSSSLPSPTNYQADSPHHNLKDTMQFQPLSNNPSSPSAQFIHYQKYQQQKKQDYNQSSEEQNEEESSSLSYSEMKERREVSDQIIAGSSELLRQGEREKESSRGIILGGDIKVVESKLESGGKLVVDSNNRVESKVIQRQSFSNKQASAQQRAPQVLIPSQGPPETSIRTIEASQTAKNLLNQNSRNQVQNQYQLHNEVLAKVSSNQNRYPTVSDSVDEIRLNPKRIDLSPPLNPQALVETVERQMAGNRGQEQEGRYVKNHRVSSSRSGGGIGRPTSSYENEMRQQEIHQSQRQQPQIYQQNLNQQPVQAQIHQQHHYPNQPQQQPPQQLLKSQPPPSISIQNSLPTQPTESFPGLFRPLNPKSPFQTPSPHPIRKSIGLAHHNRLGSPARQLQPSFLPLRNHPLEYSPRTITNNDYYYTAAKQFPTPHQYYQQSNQLKTKLITNPSPSRVSPVTSPLRPTSSGPRVLSPRPLHQPSSYVPTALLAENNRNNNFREHTQNVNLKLPPLSPKSYQNQFPTRPLSPGGGLTPRTFLSRPTSSEAQPYHYLNTNFSQMKPAPVPPPPPRNNSPAIQRATSPPKQKNRQGISVTSRR